jgi:hypothetical protein
MEDELFQIVYRLLQEEGSRVARHKYVQFTDAAILATFFWAVIHDRPISWACQRRHWGHSPPLADIPSPGTMSRRLRTLSVKLLLERVYYRLAALSAEKAFCLVRIMDSKPLPVGGFSKDRDAHRGYATGGKCKGYKLFCCWGTSSTLPEVLTLGPMNQSDQAGGIQLIDQLDRLHNGQARGYVLADSTHDTNPLHDYVGEHGLQLIAPRKKPGSNLGHCAHSPYRLRSIALLEPPELPLCAPAKTMGPQLYRQRGQIERDYGQLTSFGCGLQPLPSWVRRPHRVVLWVIGKLIVNAIRIYINKGLTP